MRTPSAPGAKPRPMGSKGQKAATPRAAKAGGNPNVTQSTVHRGVLAAGTNAGNNPAASFRAIVSCLTGAGGTENVMTDPFPATTGPASAGGGNSQIEADVTLPQPCIAPIVFVASATGSWFAATGG